mmetsp:Transcript_73683/g.134860  ORF Transcript_73683/g.134860 Transcript_73683/m.134860 type:complete len:1147 (-) Transcript_73683:47-3487(-)
MATEDNVVVEEGAEEAPEEEVAEEEVAEEEGEALEDVEGEEEAEVDGEGGDAEAEALAKEEEEKANAAKNAGSDINTESFDELRLDDTIVQAANDAWRLFINTADSREAAGEAIYAALFEGAPSLQSLFTTPRAVQAMKFMNGLASFVNALDDPAKLKILVETLAFGHLHLDVTVPRVMIFRDAILDLFKVELVEKFSPSAREGWKKLLNYVGGALIYVKVNYATRINCLLKSWKEANHGDTDKKDEQAGAQSSSTAEEEHQKKQAELMQKKKKRTTIQMLMGKKSSGQEDGGQTTTTGEKNDKGDDNRVGTQSVPTTYPEMFLFNSAVMGFGTSSWMAEVLACFNNIVTNVANSARLQEECDVLALRIARVAKGNINLAEYKSCMLASLRSLLPKSWDSAHEVAWTWLWENVERLVLRIHGQPPVWEKALGKILGSFDEESKFELRKEIYARFFNLAPAGQDFFKQSNTYLHFIADKILDMTLQIYQNPVKMVDDISALGLRHVGYGIPTELFGPFVTACVEVLMGRTSDETTVESFRWSLGLISKMLVRTITEGCTIVMKAINNNSQKAMRKSIACAPRGERADWMLIVQVGTRSISPLAWSLESGNLEAATAIIKDLLSFRADRDRYYYGAHELFTRHPDIIKMLCDYAPPLLPILLHGLIWRSRLAENGMRRVNYYVKHLLMDEEGGFNKTLSWICNMRDPKIVCHPIIILLSDLVWSRAASLTFLYGKLWFVLTLIVFIMSQSVLQHVGKKDGDEVNHDDVQRAFIFAGRCFIYLCSMTQLLYSHLRDASRAYKKKNTVSIGFLRLPKYLNKWQDVAGLLLTISLMVMLALEPILWCWQHNNGRLFEERCDERANMRFAYTLFSMFAMFLKYALLIDLTVNSTRISAFVLVCVRMLSEVALFLGALAFAILTASSAISVLKQESPAFAGIHQGSLSLFQQVVGTFSSKAYEELEEEPIVLAAVFVFLIVTIILLLNLLIAQLSCAYSAVYEDMVGYARLERAEIIVEIMPSVPMSRWSKFTDSLRLNRKLEFNEGDTGPSGGIQVKEPASANPTTVDMIQRFGGSTSPEMPWTGDQDGDGDEDDRFTRIEKLLEKTLKRINDSHGGRKGGAGRQGSFTGTGSSAQLSGSASSAASGSDRGD